jgi:hypothetical protein
MTLSRLPFLLFVISMSNAVFSQQVLTIGDNKKIVTVLELNTKLTIGFQDLQLLEKGKPSFFIAAGETKSGPFDDIQKKTINAANRQVGPSPDTSYVIVTEKGKDYILYGRFRFGPYKSPELLKINQKRAVIADFSANGMYYEVFSLEGNTPKSIIKSTKYTDDVTGIYVSDNMDVLMSFDNSSSEASQYFIYKGKKTDGFYHAVHFEGWMTTENDGLDPVFSCVAPLVDDTYDVTNDLYVGNRLVEKIVAVLYDFSFNNTNTDFVVKGYTASQDGARVYSSNSVLGPYDAVDNLLFDSLGRVQFEYEQDGSQFLYENNVSKPISKKEDYDWKNIAPNGVDYLKCVSSGDTGKYYFNDKLIASGDMWNIRLVTWTQHYGPVLFEEVMKPAEPNPDPDGEKWHGEVIAGFRLIVKGESTKTFESILDFKESSNGEIAYIAYENDGFYVFRGSIKYGPYSMVYTIGKERENFLKWDDDDLIYSAISEGKSHVFVNGKSMLSYRSIISFYWNQTFSSSAIVQIKDEKCFLESDFYSKSLDREPFMEQLEEQFQDEFMARREELLAMTDCSSIHFMGKEYTGLTFVHGLKSSPDGSAISFMNMDSLNLIYKNELLNGTIYNNSVVYYKNGNIVVAGLDKK